MHLFNKKKINSGSYLVIRNGYKGIQVEKRNLRKITFGGEF